MSMPRPLDEVLVGLAPDMDPSTVFLSGVEHSMTFGELADGVARTRGLFARLGIAAGERVAIATSDDQALSQLYGACLAAGVVAVVVDPDASAAEINVLLAHARVAAVFADAAVVERAGALQTDDSVASFTIAAPSVAKTGFGLLRRKSRTTTREPNDTYPGLLVSEAAVTDTVDLTGDEPALILFTSGTTSQPKGVVLTRANLSAQLDTFARQYGYDASSRFANHLPTHHTDGLNQGPLLAMSLGCTWIRPGAVDMQSLGDVLDRLQRERATHLITVPTVIAMMTRLPDAWDDCFGGDDFRFISSTAGYLDEQIWRSVEDRFSTLIVNSYGLTETVMEALYCGPDADTRRHGTIGKPVDCEARIVDGDDNEVAPGETGELLLRGTNIMAGYFEHPEATAAALTDEGWLRTGDLARLDGGHYVIAGRKKNVIIRGGINVYPEDVNSVLLGAPGVTGAATVGVPDSFLGELVVACVSSTSPGAVEVPELMEHCRGELAVEKVPNRIVVVDALPYGPSGKVELAKVAQMVSGALDGPVEGSDPGEQVLQVAARVFGQPVEALSAASTPDSTPGWDSLSFLELIMSLERQFDMSIPPRDVMTMASLGDAVALVQNR